ncbi:MAG TPA: ABC transporter substrate-binding protein [Spongiibacteraceae bacterium]|nr:ABC transporter substrate-binding protein [Spongiibacteraceae bacterium]
MPNCPLRKLIALICLACLPWAVRASVAAPQRIASLNLCTDQLLLMLVPRARIASVTDWAARPESSYMAAAAQGIPTNHGSIETVLTQHPDLILASEYTDAALLLALKRLGYRVEIMAVPKTLAQTRGYILHVGDLVGARTEAQRLVDNMSRRLLEIDNLVESSSGAELAAVYAPNGMTVGRGAVLAEIIERAGWRNLGDTLPIRGYGPISLEQLLVAQPRLLVLDVTVAGNDNSIANGYLAHPALSALKQRARTVVVPPTLSECVGPNTIDAIELLAAQR